MQGDIAKHLKAETKKFKKIDKDWKKIVMDKAQELENVKNCCMSDIIRDTLVLLQVDLEACQKELNKYLEKKRKKFPRFYFVSDDVLLKFLSQGSEPQNIQDDFDKLFDSISLVKFAELEKKDKIQKIEIIGEMLGEAEENHEPITLLTPVSCTGNIEEWLISLEEQMRATVKAKISDCYNNFVMKPEANEDDKKPDLIKMNMSKMLAETCGQVALMAVQMRWTKLIDDGLRQTGTAVSTSLKHAREET